MLLLVEGGLGASCVRGGEGVEGGMMDFSIQLEGVQLDGVERGEGVSKE